MDDVALVQRATALDKDAFGVVYERYATRLYDYLWWVLQDREEAAYALYDTFLEAGARLGELGDPAKLRPWLFAIASNEALGRGRHRDKGDATNGRADEPSGTDAGAGQTDAWGELKHVVRAIAVDLSPQDRALLDLRYRQDLEDEELAEAVGITPERAADLLERLTDRVENLLGETAVAFLGRTDCPVLTELLGPWDDHLDARQRDLVDEHVPTCPTCGERRQRRIPASALLGASPAVAVPGGVGPRVLEDVDLAARHGRPWSARRNGFPPPLIGARHRQRLAVGAAAAAVILVLAAAAFVVGRGGGIEQVASTGASSVPTTTFRPSTTFSTLATDMTTTSLPAVGDPAAAGAVPGAANQPGGTASGGSGSGSGGSGGGGGGSGTTTPAPSGTTADTTPPTNDTTTTTSPPPTSPPTTADTTPPALSGLSVSPNVVKAGSKCTNGDPTQATVTVNVTDASGIASVRVVLAGVSGGSVPMTATGGGNYTAVVGPFDTPVQSAVELPGKVVVQATDTAGNTASASADLRLRCAA